MRLGDQSVLLENITISYQQRPVVHHVSGAFELGSLTAILGPNGAGKSTLLKAIAGITKVISGQLLMSQTMRRHLAYMPQTTEMRRDFPLSTLELVCSGLWRKQAWWKPYTREQRNIAVSALNEVGLEGFEDRTLASLSTGQLQRVLFARIIVQDAPLILLDEPFSAVDSETAGHLLELMQSWAKQGRTVICVLHHIEHIRRYFPQCLLLARECIGWGETADILTPAALFSARFFREAWAAEAEICERA